MNAGPIRSHATKNPKDRRGNCDEKNITCVVGGIDAIFGAPYTLAEFSYPPFCAGAGVETGPDGAPGFSYWVILVSGFQ